MQKLALLQIVPIILLAGGGKFTQSKDIKLALQFAQDLEEEL